MANITLHVDVRRQIIAQRRATILVQNRLNFLVHRAPRVIRKKYLANLLNKNYRTILAYPAVMETPEKCFQGMGITQD